MNRKIAFRAWYKGAEYPFDKDCLEPHEMPQMIYKVQYLYDGSGVDKNPVTGAYCSFGSILDDDDFILMQSTGLSDKNGTEIYEGDIIRFSIKCKGKDWVTGEVVWDKKNAEFDFAGWSAGDVFYDYGLAREDADCQKYGVEVIGNIYENPECLTN